MAYGTQSLENINECHPDLRMIAFEFETRAARIGWDVTCTDGHRPETKQNELYPKFTLVKWPNSKHNKRPSLAIHLAKYPIEYPQPEDSETVRTKKTAIFYMSAMLVMQIAEDLGISIRGGWDWDRDGEINDQTFDDLMHTELYGVVE